MATASKTGDSGRESENPRKESSIRRAIASVPLPLAALLAAVLIVGLAWALLVPAWQSPDATSHFAYAQSLAERFALPDNSPNTNSTDQGQADVAVGASSEAFSPLSVHPNWSAAAYQRYLLEAGKNPSRSDGGGVNTEGNNPPLYYLYADLAYWADYGGDAFDRLYAMQIWGVSLLLLTTLGAWLLAGEVLGRRRLPQLACAAVAAFEPMETFISTSVTPDGMLVALWTLAFWLGARVIVRRARQRDAIALCAITAAAILTKATSYALLPAVLFALLVGWLRRPAAERRAAVRELTPALLALAVPVFGWIEIASALSRQAVNALPAGGRPFNLRQFLSYVWQFYLPRLPGQTPTVAEPLAYYEIWIREGWGDFGWLDLLMPNWVFNVIAWVWPFILIPAVALVTRFRDRLRVSLLTFFALGLVALLGLVHLVDYQSIISTNSTLLQGRYALPVVSLFGLAVGFVVRHLPLRLRAPACGALVAALLLLQVLALGTIARTYYT